MPKSHEREIAWQRIEEKLVAHLDSIPFTRTQRADIDYRIDLLHELFKQANI